MRTITAREAEQEFKHLIEKVQVEPVTVTSNGTPSAVLLSIADYERLRGTARQRLGETIARMQAYAASQGLTEAELDRLLADEA